MRFANALSFFRRQPARIEQDPADLGTAFGMEASLEDEAFSAPPAADLDSAAVSNESESPLSWLLHRNN